MSSDFDISLPMLAPRLSGDLPGEIWRILWERHRTWKKKPSTADGRTLGGAVSQKSRRFALRVEPQRDLVVVVRENTRVQRQTARRQHDEIERPRAARPLDLERRDPEILAPPPHVRLALLIDDDLDLHL